MKTSFNPSAVARHSAIAAGIVLSISLGGCAHEPLRYASPEPDYLSVADLPPDVTAPMPIHPAAPEFPLRMRRAGIEGFAEIYCLVDATGAARDLAVVKDSDTEFALSARDAVAKWQFAPGTRHGRPVTMGAVIPFQFVFVPETRLP